MTTQKIARSIDLAMEYREKTNKELAELLEVSESRASLLRNGKADLRIDQLYAVAGWLGYGTDDLARGLVLVPASKAA